MPQDPIQVDAIQIAPGETGTRLIERDPTTGGIRITDPTVSGLTMADLAGLRSVANVFVVGKSGSGAQYNTVQDAIDAVPATSSLTAPSIVYVLAGVYSEQVTIEKDGIWLMSPGGAVLEAPAAGATVIVQSAVATDPNWLRIQNLRIVNSFAGDPCIDIIGGATSVIGSTEVGIVDCDLVASGAGAFQVRAATVNNIRVQGGTWAGSHSTSLLRATQCARCSVRDVDQVVHLQLDYNTADPTPSLVSSSYHLSGLTLLGNIMSSLNGVGSLTMDSVQRSGAVGDVTLDGDGVGTFEATNCDFDAVVVNNSAPLVMRGCKRTSIAGAGTVAEDIQRGSVTFAASSSEVVAFSVAAPDDDYHVTYETELTEAVGITSVTSAGFTVSFAGNQSTTVKYAVHRRL